MNEDQPAEYGDELSIMNIMIANIFHCRLRGKTMD